MPKRSFTDKKQPLPGTFDGVAVFCLCQGLGFGFELSVC